MWGQSKNILRAIVVSAVLVCAAPTAASAADGYPPDTPREPGLGGSQVSAGCRDGVPWITYTVRTVGFAESPVPVSLELSDGVSRLSLDLTAAADGSSSGTLAWPGVRFDGDGRLVALPGWTLSSAGWVQTDDAAAFTRGDLVAVLHAGGASLDVPLSYPDACAAPAASRTILPATGGGQVSQVALAGAVIVTAGAVILLIRRRDRGARR